MLFHGVAVTMIALLISNNAVGASDELWPSEAVTLINNALRLNLNPDARRTDVTTPFIERMRTDELSEMEFYFKGESHFLHLQPEPARDVYWEFRNRSDSLGRVAAQRLMVIRINAFGMISAILKNDIPNYRRRFPVQSNDRYGITFPVSRTATALIDQDRADEALDLIVAQVNLHDEFDSAYTAYRLPYQFLEIARRNGRAREFIDLHNSVVSGLDAAIKRRLSADPVDPKPVKKLPGIVFRSLFEDSDLTYHGWTAAMMDLLDELRAVDAID